MLDHILRNIVLVIQYVARIVHIGSAHKVHDPKHGKGAARYFLGRIIAIQNMTQTIHHGLEGSPS